MNRIITLAYTAIVLVAVGVEGCLLNSLKPSYTSYTSYQFLNVFGFENTAFLISLA